MERLEHPDAHAYASLIRECGRLKTLHQGRRVHQDVVQSGYERDTFLGNLLVDMYGRCGSVGEASHVFEKIHRKNRFSWNILLAAFAMNGHLSQARDVFDMMAERDVVSWNTMLGAYLQHGALLHASRFFKKIPYLDVISWNLMMTAYAMKGHNRQALQLLYSMQMEGLKPNAVTFTLVLDALDADTLACVTDLERLIIENGFLSDLKVCNALMNVFGMLKRIDKVEDLFVKLPRPDVVSWTTRIAAHARNSQPRRALRLFPLMDLEGLHPDKITFIILNEACGEAGDLSIAMELHDEIRKRSLNEDTKVGNSLVNMYGRCRCLTCAREVFAKMQRKDVITWTALITANANNGHPHEAMRVFSLMDLEGVGLDKVACISVVDACTSAGKLSQGRLVHSSIASARALDSELQNALLNMYSKCGSMEDAIKLLECAPSLDMFGWNSRITAYAQNAQYHKAIESYREMTLQGLSPDSITFISVLNACSHTGSLEESWSFFESMVWDHGIRPVLDHYVCMVDLLGRVGEVNQADELVKSMPVRPNDVAWRSLLGACGTSGDLGRGKLAAGQIHQHKYSDIRIC